MVRPASVARSKWAVVARSCRLGELGVLPPPLWGRVGEGGSGFFTGCVRQLLPPPPTPPHKGERSRPCLHHEHAITPAAARGNRRACRAGGCVRTYRSIPAAQARP